MPANEEELETEAELTARLESLTPSDATAILADLASALFPSGHGALRQVTWEPSLTPPRLPGVTDPRPDATPEAMEEAKLRAAELRYRTLVEQIPAVTFMAVLGEGENEVYVSPHIETLLGFTQKEWLEDPFLWYSQIHEEDRGVWMEEFARGCRTGGPFRAECRLLARNGRVVWVRGEARLIKDEHGRPMFLQGVAFDITESKRAQERGLRQAVRRTEERYRDLVQRLDAVFWEAEAPSGRFSFVSGGAQRILGFPARRWLDDPDFWIGRVHPDDREYVKGRWRHAMSDGGDHEFEFRALSADDEIVWLHNSVHQPLVESSDARALGIMVDITERKRIEERLARSLTSEQSARREAEALNRIGRAIAAELDLEHLTKQVVELGADLTGAERAAFCQLSIEGGSGRLHVQPMQGPASADSVKPSAGHPLLSAIFAGSTVRMEDARERSPSVDRTDLFPGFELRSYLGVPVVSRSEEVWAALVFGHSTKGWFTPEHERLVAGFAAQAAVALDNAHLYDAAERARETAETANRLKDEFLATMSHELRTPVNAVLGWATLLLDLDEVPDSMRDRALTAIKSNAEAQAQLVDDLLDISRIVTGNMRLEVQSVDLVAVVETAIEAITLAAQAKQIQVSLSSAEAPGAILGAADRLRQVVTNLLTNAVKFTPAGGKIDVSVYAVGGAARVQVSDTGQGIEPGFLPHIFESFRQEDGSLTRSHAGLGLGLAIVRHLAELHGGSVRAESPGIGCGATFTVELPLAADESRDQEPGRSPLSEVTDSLRGARILVVDDDADSLELLTGFLERAGADVSAASSAAQARPILNDLSFDLLVFDLGMPGVDGFQLLKEVRSGGGPNESTPAAAVTAHATWEDRRRGLVAGYQAHIPKPVAYHDALTSLAGLVSLDS